MKTIGFDPKELERFDFALSDILWWLSGFKAAGGDYSPGTEGALRDLRDALQRGGNIASAPSDGLDGAA